MSDSSTPSSEKLGSGLRGKLAAMRRRLVRVEVTRRLAIALSIAIVGMAAFLLVDWLADLPLATRTGGLIGLGVVVAILLLWALLAFVTMRRDDEPLALMVEAEQPGFRSRLIASVQFARGKASVPDPTAHAMVERLLEDTESYAKDLHFTDVINARPLKRALLGLILLGSLAAAAYFGGGAISQDLLKRAFLSDLPVPRETRVVWTTGDVKVGIGDALTLEARVEGDAPERGTLRIRSASGHRETIPLARVDSEPGRYSALFENVQESFTYLAAINDGRSERKKVRALPRPMVVDLVGRQTYPPYTKLKASDHRPGEFLLFPGSELALTITASQPLRSGTVRLLGQGGLVETVVDPDDPRRLHARFTAPEGELTGFTVGLLDTEEMASQDATVYRVDVLTDEPPKVRIVRPSRQRELVTATARVLVGYEADDRFGIEKLALHFVVNDGVSQGIDLPIAERGAKRVEESLDWPLAEIQPPLEVGDEIRFWVEGHDQNAGTATGKSADRILVVVTPREKRDDLLSRVGDYLGRVDQATGNQERLNAVLADWIRAQAPLPTGPPPKPRQEQETNRHAPQPD